MDKNAILNAMEKKAKSLYDKSSDYRTAGKRGVMVVEIKDSKNPDQWESLTRNFGAVYRFYQYEGELVISNGTNFEALVHGKVAFCKRTEKNSGTNYYQVLGYESFWPGGMLSDDGNCICAFAGLSGEDDAAIAEAGITCYESLIRTASKKEKPETEEEAVTEEVKEV